MSETNVTISDAGKDAESPAERNWRIVKTALLGHITRRRNALARLAPETFDPGALPTDIARVGDNASALLDLFDSTERAVDRVFASRSRRTATRTPSATPSRQHDTDAFKAN